MGSHRMRTAYVAALIMIAALTIGACLAIMHTMRGKRRLVIFCAGSLYRSINAAAEQYSNMDRRLEIIIEPSGSVVAMRKVTELRKRCDVLALADYTLIAKYMIPKHASFCVIFASNEIVLCYTDKSKYHDMINSDNWYEILARPGVIFGFSNPNDDPAGYRALMVLALSSLHYDKPIFRELVEKNTNIRMRRLDNGTIVIEVPPMIDLNLNKIRMRSKSLDLVTLLKEGMLDYALLYRSEAIAHNLSYVELPSDVNLGSPAYNSMYASVKVVLFNGTDKEKEIPGKAILYGLTIPDTVENHEDAVKFIRFLVSGGGARCLEQGGLKVLRRPMIIGKPPRELESLKEG